MGFLDKIKDLFSDEEEVIETKEVEVEEREEHKLPTFMRKKIEEEEKKIEEVKEEPIRREVNRDSISDRDTLRSRTVNNNFSFPIEMDEPDYFETPRYGNQNVLVKKKEEEKKASLYSKKDEPKPKRFKPTPVISPVYGVLDKNYTKDEVKVQDESAYEIQRSSKKVDFETVRNKAFGSLTDDIRDNLCENCELYQEVKITKNADKKKKIEDDNLLSDMMDERTSSENVSIGTAEENYFDFGVSYEQPKKEAPDVVINANNVTLDASESDIKIVNHNEEESNVEKIEVKEEIPKRKTPSEEFIDTKEFEKIIPAEEESIDGILENYKEEDNNSDNDIFNLIDSMYDEEDK